MELKKLDRVAIGKRIQAARNSANLSQEKLAEMLGVGSKFISQIERGANGFSLENFAMLCQITGFSADYILFGKTGEDSNLVPGVAEALSTLSPEGQEFWKETILKANYII